ncbi:MAG: hypothetical protein KGJ13_08450 [Patescibacteria group bacterium]|nr:hypothetical protein [Patescibacteria group bacterium]
MARQRELISERLAEKLPVMAQLAAAVVADEKMKWIFAAYIRKSRHRHEISLAQLLQKIKHLTTQGRSATLFIDREHDAKLPTRDEPRATCSGGEKMKIKEQKIEEAQEAYDAAKASAQKAYEAAMAPAREAYNAAKAPAWKAYEAAMAPAQKAYDAAMAPAQKAYDAANAPAWKAYEAAIAPAREAYEAAIAKAKGVF